MYYHEKFTFKFLVGLGWCLACCLLPSAAWAQQPDPDNSYVTKANTFGTVSILTLPNGTGDPESAARLFGGGTMDATITLTLLDADSNPVVGYPETEMRLCYGMPDCGWFCINGNIADGPTDENGQTTFSAPHFGGGHGGGRDTRIVVGSGPDAFEIFLTVGDCFDCHYYNSPDINGDLTVNLADVALFANDYFTGHDYRSDFVWDAVLNLSDIVVLASGLGASCPPGAR